MPRWFQIVLSLVLFAAAMGPPPAVASDCSDAVDRYNQTMQDSAYQARRYGNCVGQSRGNDDCYTEFRRLKGAHDDFESAINNYRSNCN